MKMTMATAMIKSVPSLRSGVNHGDDDDDFSSLVDDNVDDDADDDADDDRDDDDDAHEND